MPRRGGSSSGAGVATVLVGPDEVLDLQVLQRHPAEEGGSKGVTGGEPTDQSGRGTYDRDR